MFLSDDIQKKLRDAKIIQENEVITKQGDILLAINVMTKERRILNLNDEVLKKITSERKNENKQLLKG